MRPVQVNKRPRPFTARCIAAAAMTSARRVDDATDKSYAFVVCASI